jgi:hydroxypyruvate reductase
MKSTLSDCLTQIFQAAVDRVDPYEMIRSQISLEGSILSIDTETVHESIDLDTFGEIVVLGAGKAAAPMARALEDLLGERITRGTVVVKTGHTESLGTIDVIEAAHPVPDQRSVDAAERLLAEARAGTDESLFLIVVSGGGSALLESPRQAMIDGQDVRLSLDDIQRTTSVLLACGAAIDEINTVRKHLSAVKGGQLASALYPAHSISLILSDVVGDKLDVIGSGLTVPDPTTYSAALAHIESYGIARDLPKTVMRILTAGAEGLLEETPKPGDTVFKSIQNVLVGTNYQALLAAEHAAETLGFNTVIITSRLVGEARNAAAFIAAVAGDVRRHDAPVRPPACLLFGGETTVTLKGHGLGGRNQEMALDVLNEMVRDPESLRDVAVLCASTDGSDGPTDAAGAFATPETVQRAQTKSLDPQEYLARNDSYRFFDNVDGLLRTGPTRTNVCDVQIVLVPE